MWVTFFIDETSEEIIFSKYQVQDEAAVDLPRELSSEELVNLVVEKAAVDTTELRRKGAVKVNLRVATFNDLVLEPARRKHSGSRSSTEEGRTNLPTCLPAGEVNKPGKPTTRAQLMKVKKVDILTTLGSKQQMA
ncbi:uncharacterized protein LOC142814300 [Rhipicephalus microplus]|uniref:uncharacterized protein LOC142814300 n=1 Tax=Rhipicephalus microplus TaxID=6941 RepID=UPI003F6AA0F3